MSVAATLRAGRAVAAVAARQALVSRVEVTGRVMFHVLLLFIFSRLWRVVPFGVADARAPVWYIAITEWVILSIPAVHLDIERDFASGDVAYFLPQPVSWVSLKVAEAMGGYVLRLLVLGAVALPATFWFAGGFPADAAGLPFALPLALAAGLLGILVQAVIGVCAIWMTDVSPLYWIWQKCCFVFGGLVVPLDIYPAWVQTVARHSPFAAMLYGPGRTALGLSPSALLETAVLLAGWTVVALVLLRVVVARGLRVLDVNGG